MMFRQTALATVAATLALCSLSAHADKKEQIQKLVTAQQTELENLARNIATQPAARLANDAQQFLVQAVPEDKREAAAKQVDAEIKKYVDSAIPTIRASAIKLAPASFGPVMEERFTEDELKQLVTMLESPILKRYQAAQPEMANTLVEKILEDARPAVNPKLQAASTNIRKILDTASGGKLSAAEKAAAEKASAPAAKPAAAKPAVKK